MKQLLILTGLVLSGFTMSQSANPPRFVKYFVAAESYESAGVVDVDGNGTLDIVSGDFWYENDGTKQPTFRKRHLMGHQKREDQYYDDFSTIPFDVNADGRADIITGGWWSGKLRWLENVSKDDWPIHEIANVGNVETTRAWDIDGDGKPEICPNNPGKPLVYLKYQTDHTFKSIPVHSTQGHGLGFGDVNGDGRGDFIISDGWLQQGGERTAPTWTYHPEFKLGTASVPVLVVDVDGDKSNDLIVGQGHGYGLHWYSQGKSATGRTWTRHSIDEKNSQYHVMEWVDITGDGKPELLTGKRYRAHNDNDPGSNDPVGLYYFTVEKGIFKKNVISYGTAGEGKGTGIQFATADLRGTGRTDIVVAGKDGLYVFFNEK
ncbi:FG-GAP repeat domain-containing protein [Fibrella forsythiae]|uniref:VCBS repeat-containing protein n=1 Tax=Fibrella forsythiae TaxID=2817061 RepID=A0ABS3JDQ3_9BACT|nr:VCBS repeat-containing protein [Fibrella forsythiae]MBO0947399.1 VCBS repeat-containing protein [Fibrella forsythiae]